MTIQWIAIIVNISLNSLIAYYYIFVDYIYSFDTNLIFVS